MNHARIGVTALLVLVLALALPIPADATEPDRPLVALTTCRSPPAADTVGRVQFLRVARASCHMARRIASGWDALCRSEPDPHCVLRTRPTWRCVSAATADQRIAVRCLSGWRHARFFWAG